MRLIVLLVNFLLFVNFSNAQQTLSGNNLLIGYQEFPTNITSHSTDVSGCQYYTGNFKGQLQINNQILAVGNGLEDIFWVKTDSNGKVLKFKTYGSANSERSYENSLAMGTNKMLFGFNTMESLQLDDINFQPYTFSNSSFASALVCVDTSGKVLWAHKTNLQNFQIFFADNIYHVFAHVISSTSTIKLDDIAIKDSIGRGLVHLMLNEAGGLLGVKTITPRNANQSVGFVNFGSFSDKTLFLQLRASGDSSFYINQTPVNLPSGLSNYEMLMKIDTGYHHFRIKNLNPQRQNLGGWYGLMMPATSTRDSIYQVFTIEQNSVPYVMDGFTQLPLQNQLYVFDSTLTLRRQVVLGNAKQGNHPTNGLRRRIFFRGVLFQNNQLYLNGVYTGTNESPLNVIPIKDTAIKILPGIISTINQNGPSQSFVARVDMNGQNGKIQWYGNHSEYENIDVSPIFFHTAGTKRIAFTQNSDNVWNPWLFDENLNTVSGSMRKNADLPETVQTISFFPDGSRIILGQARGKTALDSNSIYISNSMRRDAFVARLRANDEVVWYKRFHSTLTSVDARRLEVRNNKAYFLLNYVGSQNDSNYIRVNNSNYSVGVNASLLANVDTNGNLTVLNLNTPILKSFQLFNFSFFTTGDLAVSVLSNPVPYQSFPLIFSPQIFRVNSSDGMILEGRKFLSTGLSIYSFGIDNNDQLYLSGTFNSSSPQKISLHDGTKVIDSLTVSANNTMQLSLLKMGWSRLQWLKRFSGLSIIRQNGEMSLVNNLPIFSVASPANSQPLLYDGQTIHNGYSQQVLSLVKINGDGSIANKKVLTNFYPIYMKTGSSGKIHVSGFTRSTMQVDTIQIGYTGGTTDAVGLSLDTNLIAKQSFRVASPYSETMNDMDVYKDSVAALAYTAQTVTQVHSNRSSVIASDYDENAYVGLVSAKQNLVTGINNSLPAFTSIFIAPNPISNQNVNLSISSVGHLRTLVTVHETNGRVLMSTVINLTPGTKYYSVSLPANTPKGVYQIVLSNKTWTTSRSFISL